MAGLFASMILLVPINSANSIIDLSMKNDAEDIVYKPKADDKWVKILSYETFDDGNWVIQTTDGGYVVVSSSESLMSWYSVVIYKLNNNGNVVWKKIFGDEYSYLTGSSVIETNDHGYVVTGCGCWLVKLDNNGKIIWEKIGYFGTEGNEIIQTFDGGLVIVGYEGNYKSKNIFLLKTDSNGNKIWAKTFDNEKFDYGCSIKQSSDGGYIIVGYSSPVDNGEGELWLFKTDGNGTLLWENTFSDIRSKRGYSVQITDDDGFIIAGCKSTVNTDYDILLMKTDRNGTLLWEKTFGGKHEDIGYSVQTTDEGGYIIAGNSYKNILKCSAILIKTDSEGDKEWSKTYFGSIYQDYAKSVQQTDDGGYILTGVHEVFLDSDVFLIKTDDKGSFQFSMKNRGTNDGLFYRFLGQFPLLQKLLFSL
jgi:hypothetical protein